MQIVIDLPDEILKTINENKVGNTIYKAIKNGTPLPKGHGRLIDASVVDDNIFNLARSIDLNYEQISEVVVGAQTIIEADKENE